MRIFGAMLILAMSASGCDLALGCDDSLVWGITVEVKQSDQTPICDATVTAVDGDYTETLMAGFGDACTYFGAGERSGTYQLRVEKAGFVTETMNDVEVEDESCHVKPANVALTLNTAP